MRAEKSDVQDREARKSKPRRGMKFASGLLVGAALFLLGIGVGNGRIQLPFDSGQSQNQALPSQLDYAKVDQLYSTLRSNYDGELDASKLIDGMLHGLAGATDDPYTVYLSREEADEFSDDLNGTFSGIGAELGLDDEENLIIVSPIEGFPASKAGIRPQDKIIGINDESAFGLSIMEAVNKIRGPKGSDVKLTVLRANKEIVFTITRDDIKIPSVEQQIIDGIGYLQINQFGDDTASLARRAARDFKDKGIRGVVLDMRGNPGGRLDAAIDIASLWLASGATVLEQKSGGRTVSTELASGNPLLKGIPTAVLINEGSASASEIVAGALKDNNVATLVGAKSFGKGSVQEIHDLRDGGQLKVTAARWYRPNGENIDKKGVSPDREVKMTDEDYEKGRDPQKDAAFKLLR